MFDTKFTIVLRQYTCASCGIPYGIEANFDNARREDGKGFHCPNGHSLSYATTEFDKLKRENQSLNSQLNWAVSEAEDAKRGRTVARAKLTKFKNRVANGVCPCCHRTFKQLAAHMTNKHPDFKKAVG